MAEANRLSDDHAACKEVKSSRCLLLRNPKNVIGENDQIRLGALLAANQALTTVHALKDGLQAL